MNKEGVLYVIYRYRDKGIEPYPYAVTDRKSLKNAFIKERGKKHFKIDTVDYDDKSPFLNGNNLLCKRVLKTKGNSVSMALTGREDLEMTLHGFNHVITELSKYVETPMEVFCNKLYDALSTLGYGVVYDYAEKCIGIKDAGGEEYLHTHPQIKSRLFYAMQILEEPALAVFDKLDE